MSARAGIFAPVGLARFRSGYGRRCLEMPKCKGCGAEIVWIKTANGKRMPLDSKEKKFYCAIDGEWKIYAGREAHWATCPKANDFKKGVK